MLASVECCVFKKKSKNDAEREIEGRVKERGEGEERVISRFQHTTRIYDLIYLLLKMYY